VPLLSRVFVRLSFAYLMLGFILGALLFARSSFLKFSLPAGIMIVHSEFLLNGWLIQLAMSVAFWILPRFVNAAPRGNETVAWLALVLFNAGILCYSYGVLTGYIQAAQTGKMLEALSIISFLANSWSRLRPVGPSCSGE
jgi:hypothetical protein